MLHMTTDAFKHNIISLQSHMQLLAEHMLGDTMEAEDAVQEVFLHLWEQRDKLERVVNIRSYVLQATRRRCIDIIRERRKGMRTLESLPEKSDDEIAEEVEMVERRSALLHSMLDDLPEKQRQIVRMRYLEEKEIPQIEQAMKMTSSNIYTTLSRAMQTLRDRFSKTANYTD